MEPIQDSSPRVNSIVLAVGQSAQRGSLHSKSAMLPTQTVHLKISKSQHVSPNHGLSTRNVDLAVVSKSLFRNSSISSRILESLHSSSVKLSKNHQKMVNSLSTKIRGSSYTPHITQNSPNCSTPIRQNLISQSTVEIGFQNYCKSLLSSNRTLLQSSFQNPTINKTSKMAKINQNNDGCFPSDEQSNPLNNINNLMEIEIPYLKKRLLDTQGLRKRSRETLSNNGLRNMSELLSMSESEWKKKFTENINRRNVRQQQEESSIEKTSRFFHGQKKQITPSAATQRGQDISQQHAILPSLLINPHSEKRNASNELQNHPTFTHQNIQNIKPSFQTENQQFHEPRQLFRHTMNQQEFQGQRQPHSSFYSLEQPQKPSRNSSETRNFKIETTSQGFKKSESQSLSQLNNFSYSDLRWKCHIPNTQYQKQNNSPSPRQHSQEKKEDLSLFDSPRLSPQSIENIDQELLDEQKRGGFSKISFTNGAKFQNDSSISSFPNQKKFSNPSFTSIKCSDEENDLAVDSEVSINTKQSLKFKLIKVDSQKNIDLDLSPDDDDPLFKNYLNVEGIRGDLKRHSYNYSFQRQARLLQIGSSRNIPLYDNHQVGKQPIAVFSSERQVRIPNEKKILEIQGQQENKTVVRSKKNSIDILDIRQNNKNITKRASKTQSFSQIQQETYMQAMALQKGRSHSGLSHNEHDMKQKSHNLVQLTNESQNIKIKPILMTKILETNDDEIQSPQKIFQATNFTSQAMLIPQIVFQAPKQASNQQKISSDATLEGQNKILFSGKKFTIFLASLKPTILEFLTENFMPKASRDQLNEAELFCTGLARKATSGLHGHYMFEQKKILTEAQFEILGRFFQEQFTKFGVDSTQLIMFKEKYSMLIEEIFKRSLIEQITQGDPEMISDLVEAVLKQLHDKVNVVSQLHKEDTKQIIKGVESVLNDGNQILQRLVENNKIFLSFTPIEFFVLKQTTFTAMVQKNLPVQVIFRVVEKIEKIRNIIFPHHKFADNYFRINIASLFLYNKVLVGYFLDPSIENIRAFVNVFWDSMYGLSTLENFVTKIKNSLKTPITFKFLESFQIFVLDNMPKTISPIEIDDIKFKFWKLKETVKSQQQKQSTMANLVNKDNFLEAFKELATLKAINKQTPLGVSEQSVFDLRLLEYFCIFVLSTPREVFSVFECRVVMQSLRKDDLLIDYWFLVLKQTLNSLNLPEQVCLDVEYLYKLLLVDQLKN